ncbi:MAG TPA: hypothetical protein VGF35_07285, partial [Steroidobacteraceae bacterium]
MSRLIREFIGVCRALLLPAVACGALLGVTGCGGGGSGSTAAPVTVSVSPSTATVQTGGTQAFSATVANSSNSAVTWQVGGVSGGNATLGTISSAGLYTAPNAVPAPAQVSITAVAAADATQSGTATVTITGAGGTGISVSPRRAAVTTHVPQQFSATATGGAAASVTWSVDDVAGGNAAVGTISSAGVYSPPGTAGTHLI